MLIACQSLHRFFLFWVFCISFGIGALVGSRISFRLKSPLFANSQPTSFFAAFANSVVLQLAYMTLLHFPKTETIVFESLEDRLKITIPEVRNWLVVGLFSLLLLVWLVGFIWMAIFTFRDVMGAGERFTFAFSVLMLIWLYIWYRLGKVVWARWQYYMANREIIFINQEELILRRPVSILGLTDAYGMSHVTPFYYSEKHHCPAFDYGYQHVYFAHKLPEDEAKQLVDFLNGRFFPDHDPWDE